MLVTIPPVSPFSKQRLCSPTKVIISLQLLAFISPRPPVVFLLLSPEDALRWPFIHILHPHHSTSNSHPHPHPQYVYSAVILEVGGKSRSRLVELGWGSKCLLKKKILSETSPSCHKFVGGSLLLAMLKAFCPSRSIFFLPELDMPCLDSVFAESAVAGRGAVSGTFTPYHHYALSASPISTRQTQPS